MVLMSRRRKSCLGAAARPAGESLPCFPCWYRHASHGDDATRHEGNLPCTSARARRGTPYLGYVHLEPLGQLSLVRLPLFVLLASRQAATLSQKAMKHSVGAAMMPLIVKTAAAALACASPSA